ncbi:MAG: hypothetical protein U0R26_06890 [Solirubrobacterales bacterium]
MKTANIPSRTRITSRADRRDERVRLIEEAVLLIRDDWPAVAAGLCESVNRAAGLIFVPTAALQRAIGETAEEALRLVERLYGHDDAIDLQRLTAINLEPAAEGPSHHPRFRPPSRTHRRVRTRAGW